MQNWTIVRPSCQIECRCMKKKWSKCPHRRVRLTSTPSNQRSTIWWRGSNLRRNSKNSMRNCKSRKGNRLWPDLNLLTSLRLALRPWTENTWMRDNQNQWSTNSSKLWWKVWWVSRTKQLLIHPALRQWLTSCRKTEKSWKPRGKRKNKRRKKRKREWKYKLG